MGDIIFKGGFASEKNEPVLRALLNALLKLAGPDRITELRLLNPYVDKQYLAEKGVILDVKAKDAQGRQYNVEVQLTDEPAYLKRSVCCMS